MNQILFQKAKPIWISGMEEEKNLHVNFYSKVFIKDVKQTKVMITAATLYRMYVNDEFAGYGPARAPHGYQRVDEIDITDLLCEGVNQIKIEVAGNNCASFYTIRQKSFLQGEIISGDSVLAYTGHDFSAELVGKKIQKVMRYSYQRTFTEVWDMNKENTPHEVSIAESPGFYLKRGVKNPYYKIQNQTKILKKGTFNFKDVEIKKDRYITQISDLLDGFHENELECTPLYTWQKIALEQESYYDESDFRHLKSGQYILLDLHRNYTGFIQLQLLAHKNSHIMLCFDEKLVNDMISFNNMDMINLLDYKIYEKDTSWELESFEAYGLRYAMLFVLDGEVEFENFALRTYEYPMEILPYEGNDEKLKEIYDAAARTLCQNTLDVYMDCPTRERAGWLCDSYYTAIAEYEMTGKVEVEPVFMENYRLYPQGTIVPKGMLPMCYPGDHLNGEHIPQWAMWYVLELEQYIVRNKKARAEDYRKLCYDLLDYFKEYENKDGMLEKLPSWNFVEWSAANDWVQDVNYPTNMLYVGMQRTMAEIYGDDELKQRSEILQEKIIKEAFNGEFFIDHGIRNSEGILEKQNNISEVCQYYAMRFMKIDLNNKKYTRLKKAVLEEFGPDRELIGELADIEPANALMGIYLRIELLLNMGQHEKLKTEIKKYFGNMAKKTGTLWEHRFMASSLNHGFASYIGAVIKNIETDIEHGGN